MSFLKPTSKLAGFFKTSQQYAYRKSETILRSEDTPSGVYFIEKGFVKAYTITPDGSENIYIILQPGDIFPGRWEFIQSSENKLFYEAISPVVVHRKPIEEFIKFYHTDLEAALEAADLNLMVISILAQRIENLEHTNSYARVISRLLSLAKRFGRQEGTQMILDLPLTHYDFAHTINVSRETASRELEKLRQKKLISEKNHFIVIKDYERLKEELEEFYLSK